METVLYATTKDYIAPTMLIEELSKCIGIEIEILEYNIYFNGMTGYVIQFKQPISSYPPMIVINYIPLYLYDTNIHFVNSDRIVAKHHHNVLTKHQYCQYEKNLTQGVYKYENYRWVKTMDTPFLYV